jgi:hypothetical protein
MGRLSERQHGRLRAESIDGTEGINAWGVLMGTSTILTEKDGLGLDFAELCQCGLKVSYENRMVPARRQTIGKFEPELQLGIDDHDTRSPRLFSMVHRGTHRRPSFFITWSIAAVPK